MPIAVIEKAFNNTAITFLNSEGDQLWSGIQPERYSAHKNSIGGHWEVFVIGWGLFGPIKSLDEDVWAKPMICLRYFWANQIITFKCVWANQIIWFRCVWANQIIWLESVWANEAIWLDCAWANEIIWARCVWPDQIKLGGLYLMIDRWKRLA